MYNLIEIDGNAFCTIAYVVHAMKECKFTKSDIDSFYKNARSGDYDHLLCVSIEMIDECNSRYECIH